MTYWPEPSADTHLSSKLRSGHLSFFSSPNKKTITELKTNDTLLSVNRNKIKMLRIDEIKLEQLKLCRMAGRIWK